MLHSFIRPIITALLALIPTFSSAITAEQLPKSGMNVHWTDFVYFTTAAPFTDAIKHSGGWYDDPGFPKDSNGYITTLESGQEARMFIFLETTHYPIGDYQFHWEGKGTLRISTCDGWYEIDETSVSPQTISVSEACESGIELNIDSTDPDDYLRNFHLYLPGYDETSGYWTDHYVDFFKQFDVIRFSWGSGANYSMISEWSERRQIDDLNWAAGSETDIGVPYEAMIALANETGADLWVTTPVRANDDFEQQMATLFRDELDDSLRFWLEWGNEQWNCGEWGYQACTYIYETIGDDTELDAPQIYAQEVVDVSDRFIETFEATGARDRLVVVLGAQTGNAWQLQVAAETIESMGKMDNIDVVAQGPYFNPYDEYDPLTPVLDQGETAIMQAVRETMEGMFDPAYEMGAELTSNFTIAAQYGKPTVAYEGGQHFTNWIGVSEETVALINRHPDMYDIYRDFFDLWEAAGGSTFVHYSSYGSYDDGEAFGMKEYYDQPDSENYKLQAMLAWIEGVEDSDSGSFPLSFSPGWNLTGSPIQDGIDTTLLQNHGGIWIYQEGSWSINPGTISPSAGFWIFSQNAQTVTLEGDSYETELGDLDSDWNLLGAGSKIREESLADFSTIWTYSTSEGWTHPTTIERGQGFWVK